MDSGRWWEFYFVRYAMGTIVGATIVNQLMRVDGQLRDALLWGVSGVKVDGAAALLLLGSYGLVFCYVASIPVLILHIARSLLPTISTPSNERWARYQRIALNALIPIIIWVAFSAAIMLPRVLLGANDIDRTIGRIELWVLMLCLGLSPMLITLAIIRSRNSYGFYKKLARARSIQNNNGELVTSYRHLREHGNSIFIVILEGLLGLCLFGAHRMATSVTGSLLILPPQFYLYGLVLFVWTLPGALVWFFATLIENQFIRDQNWSP